MIACGRAQGGSASSSSGGFIQLSRKLLAPLAFGTADVDLVTGTGPFPTLPSRNIHSSNPDNPNQVVVCVPTTREAAIQSYQHLRRVGLYRRRRNLYSPSRCETVKVRSPTPWATRYSVQPAIRHLVYRLARCGLRSPGARWLQDTTPGNANSWTHFCIHTNSQDDRESGWAAQPVLPLLRADVRFVERFSMLAVRPLSSLFH